MKGLTQLLACIVLVLLLQGCAGAGSAAAKATCDEYRPYERVPSSLARRLFDPRESDVTFIINDDPIRYKETVRDEYEKITAALQARYRKLKNEVPASREKVVVWRASFDELDKLKRVLEKIQSPYLELKTEPGFGTVYYVPAGDECFADDLGIADVLDALGLMHYKKGDFYIAQEVLAESTRIKGRHLGQRSLQVADSQRVLGMVYQADGKLDQAIDCYLVVLDMRRANFRGDSPEVLDAVQWILDVERAAYARGLKLGSQRKIARMVSAGDRQMVQSAWLERSLACGRCIPTHVCPSPILVMPQVKLIAENAVVAAEEQGSQQMAEVVQLKHIIASLLKPGVRVAMAGGGSGGVSR